MTAAFDEDKYPLFKRALKGTTEDKHAKQRARLRSAFLAMREKADVLVQQIPGSIRGLTVHDVSHLDALWGTVSLIAGDAYELTAAEAFVLGGAILLHDAAMSLAAYPGGMDDLRATSEWQDAIAREKSADTPEHEWEQKVLPNVLRQRHAKQAEIIATAGWATHGRPEHLIDDSELAASYGPLIGQIAHSHWWSVSRLPQELPKPPIGAARGLPEEWTVDPVKVACLLRVADAAHLSADRAPRFWMAVTRPTGESLKHWTYQARMAQPQAKGDTLLYTSLGAPFDISETAAWWLCFETLGMVQRELQGVDFLLSDTGRAQLKLRKVTGADDPARLAQHVRVAGWTPVDARVTVSNVPALVRALGGEQLYGDDPHVPLRELLQNAVDAIRARRLLEGRDKSWGTVTVRFLETDEGTWLEVLDQGIGMSERVLTGPLLDFGTSFWRSDLAGEELPGLAAAGMEATGKFGIGFYSVFMLGDRVTVTSCRRYGDDTTRTKTLEFKGGVNLRPILRAPRPDERLDEPGTRVRVLLKKKLDEEGGLLWAESKYGGEALPPVTAEFLLGYIAPAIDANLDYVDAGGNRLSCVNANDWLTLAPRQLIQRIGDEPFFPQNFKDKIASYVDDVFGDICVNRVNIIGRASIINRRFISDGVIVVGGFRAVSDHSFSGIIFADVAIASRNTISGGYKDSNIAEWANDQIKHVSSYGIYASGAFALHGLGGNILCFPLFEHSGNGLSLEGIAGLAKKRDQIIISSKDRIMNRSEDETFTYSDIEQNIIIADDVVVSLVDSNYYVNTAFYDLFVRNPRSLLTVIKDELRSVWGEVTVEQKKVVVGTVRDIEITRPAWVFTRGTAATADE